MQPGVELIEAEQRLVLILGRQIDDAAVLQRQPPAPSIDPLQGVDPRHQPRPRLDQRQDLGRGLVGALADDQRQLGEAGRLGLGHHSALGVHDARCIVVLPYREHGPRPNRHNDGVGQEPLDLGRLDPAHAFHPLAQPVEIDPEHRIARVQRRRLSDGWGRHRVAAHDRERAQPETDRAAKPARRAAQPVLERPFAAQRHGQEEGRAADPGGTPYRCPQVDARRAAKLGRRIRGRHRTWRGSLRGSPPA